MPKKNAQIPILQTTVSDQDLKAISPPPGLPIASVWDDLVLAVRENQVVVITGETGSGKSTQLPKIALLAGQGRRARIVCTQPRRVAARSLARRVAEECEASGLGSSLVGYKIRFRSDVTEATRIKFVTDGILLSELRSDRWLREYDTIIVDEAHERSLNIDLLLGLLKNILKKRRGMKLIITSATIEPQRFSDAFDRAPILSIPGRGFPVEKRYVTPERLLYEQDATTVDLAVSAVRQMERQARIGDILVFFATEKEIREAASILSASENSSLVLPMYGRLSAREQDLIFKPSFRRKIVLATNIAETSITVPGIRFVIDTGFARISRYSAGSRTKALPVSRISRSSADQRAGRAGRTAPGICVRLYSEEDYLASPVYTPPEILRSNLAEVILKLLDLGIRDVERFPFVDPPHQSLLKEGFTTLRELGALKLDGSLTENGRLMATLPLDPRLSRILIQANRERCLKEAAILVAALSIQDPREYPVEKKAQAEQAHALFRSTDSDFITLLNIWNRIKEYEKQGISRTKLRKYCKEHFLSYPRLLEWQDIYSQIIETLAEAGGFSLNQMPASYEAIHRSLLTGFLCNIGLHKEGTRYRGAKDREIFLFPGSCLYKKRPRWIVCSDLIKTSQLYARVVAEVKPEWIEQTAGEFAKRSWADAHWEKERGEVVAWEKVTVFGLTVVESRKVSYSRIKPDDARDIFVREAIFPGAFKKRFGFVEHNNAAFAEIESISSMTRRADLSLDEEVAIRLLSQGLSELENRCGSALIDERSLAWAVKKTGDKPLRLEKNVLLSEAMKESNLDQYPGHLVMDGIEIPLVYSFSPGSEKDGVTAQIPAQNLERIFNTSFGQSSDRHISSFEWLVPAMIQDKTLAILKLMSKPLRQRLMPLSESAAEISRRLHAIRSKDLSLCFDEAFALAIIDVCPELRPDKARLREEVGNVFALLPSHLRMRFEIISPSGKTLASGRDLAKLREEISLDVLELQRQSPVWQGFVRKWERELKGIEGLSPLPERIMEPVSGFEGFPALSFENERLFLRVFIDKKSAEDCQKAAIKALFLRELSKELDYLCKQAELTIKPAKTAGVLSLHGVARMPDRGAVRNKLAAILEKELLPQTITPLDCNTFFNTLKTVKAAIMPKGYKIIDSVTSVLNVQAKAQKEIDRLYCACRPRTQATTALKKELDTELRRIVPDDFPLNMRLAEVERIPRYLKALLIRAKRGFDNPSKDRLKAEQVTPYLEKLKMLSLKREDIPEVFEQYSMMVNEYIISVFAPELKTILTVSSKKLDNCLENIMQNQPD